MPSRRRWLLGVAALALAGAAGTAWYWQQGGATPDALVAAQRSSESNRQPSPRNDVRDQPNANAASNTDMAGQNGNPEPNLAADDNGPESEQLDRMFPTLPNGQLRLNTRTRLNLEKLLALNTPAELRAKLAQLENTLPSGAFRELNDLMDRYRNYTAAAEQMYPTGHAPADANAALAELQALHDLRVTYYGAATAQALYAEDEAVTRQLLQVMRLDTQTGLTLEQKAERAQQLLRPQ
jgi:hypothetical protein